MFRPFRRNPRTSRLKSGTNTPQAHAARRVQKDPVALQTVREGCAMARLDQISRFLIVSGALTLAGATAAEQATVGLTSGRSITGEVIHEDEESIQLRTEYGDLTFRLMDVQNVTRQGSGSFDFGSNAFGGSPSGSSDPFGSTTSSTNPFGGAAAANPFGAGASAPIGDPPASVPGSDNPFAFPASGSAAFNPFAATTGELTEDISITIPAGISPPEVPQIWDAVLFDFREEGTASVRIESNAPVQTATSTTNLRQGAIIEVGELPMRVVFKNGEDIARIAPGSLIRIVESSVDSVVVDLERGAVWFDLISGGSSSVTVNNPIAKVHASGVGAFRVADALDHGIHVALIDGDLEVASVAAQISVDLKKNSMLLVRPDGAVTPQARLNKIIAQEYRGWDSLAADWWEDMRTMIAETSPVEARGNVTVSELQSHLRKVGDAFVKFAQDTGHVPSTEEGFSILVQNRGNWDTWEGPYWEGSLPPLDCWGRPMRYKVRTARNDRSVGIVYSLGADQFDNNGDPAADVTELVLYYQLDL